LFRTSQPDDAAGPFARLASPLVSADRSIYHMVFYGLLLDQRGLPQPNNWDEWLGAICQHRLAGVALRAADRRDIEVPPGIIAALRERVFADASRSGYAVAHAVTAQTALSAGGIPSLVLKGPAIAQYAGGYALRPFGDVDFLVAPAHFRRAYRLLHGLGFREPTRSIAPWRSFDRLCREAVNMRTDDGGSLDLHHHVPPWLWGQEATLRRLLPHATEMLTQSGNLLVGNAALNLLVASLHVVSDHNQPGKTFMVWRDLLTLARVVSPSDVQKCAQLLGLTSWLRAVLLSLPVDARPSTLCDALGGSAPRPRYRRRLAALTNPAVVAHSSLSQCARLPLANAALFGLGTTFPSPSFVRLKLPNAAHPYLAWWSQAGGRYLHAPGTGTST
jgi:hypothetical protein